MRLVIVFHHLNRVPMHRTKHVGQEQGAGEDLDKSQMCTYPAWSTRIATRWWPSRTQNIRMNHSFPRMCLHDTAPAAQTQATVELDVTICREEGSKGPKEALFCLEALSCMAHYAQVLRDTENPCIPRESSYSNMIPHTIHKLYLESQAL